MDFVVQNLFLITLAVVSGLALLIPILRGAGSNGVTPSQAVMLMNRQNAALLDIRSAEEYADSHIADARSIPAAELAARTEELARLRNRPVIVVCDSGARSLRAMAVLQKAGFEQVFNLAGGLKAWKEAGQPLVTGKKPA